MSARIISLIYFLNIVSGLTNIFYYKENSFESVGAKLRRNFFQSFLRYFTKIGIKIIHYACILDSYFSRLIYKFTKKGDELVLICAVFVISACKYLISFP